MSDNSDREALEDFYATLRQTNPFGAELLIEHFYLITTERQLTTGLGGVEDFTYASGKLVPGHEFELGLYARGSQVEPPNVYLGLKNGEIYVHAADYDRDRHAFVPAEPSIRVNGQDMTEEYLEFIYQTAQLLNENLEEFKQEGKELLRQYWNSLGAPGETPYTGKLLQFPTDTSA